jgi:hypothetical protein
VLLVHEPNTIRRVLVDNAANYRKDHLQRNARLRQQCARKLFSLPGGATLL